MDSFSHVSNDKHIFGALPKGAKRAWCLHQLALEAVIRNGKVEMQSLSKGLRFRFGSSNMDPVIARLPGAVASGLSRHVR